MYSWGGEVDMPIENKNLYRGGRRYRGGFESGKVGRETVLIETETKWCSCDYSGRQRIFQCCFFMSDAWLPNSDILRAPVV